MIEIVGKTLIEANECLLDADVLLQSARYKATVTRCYYAIFHAAKAILLSIQVDAHTHQGVYTQFNKHFIKTGLFDKSFSRIFGKLLDDRLASDYEIGFDAGNDDALHAYNEAKFFYETIFKYLNQ